jgi:hypothetical protein
MAKQQNRKLRTSRVDWQNAQTLSQEETDVGDVTDLRLLVTGLPHSCLDAVMQDKQNRAGAFIEMENLSSYKELGQIVLSKFQQPEISGGKL